METSVWNFLFVDDAPEKRKITERFFHDVETGGYEIFISEAVKAEILSAASGKRERLFEVIRKFKPVELEYDESVRFLAGKYVEKGVLTEKHFADLLHLAYASSNGLFALVSWNLKHLVKMKTLVLGNAVNMENGYPDIKIFTPEQVIDNEDD